MFFIDAEEVTPSINKLKTFAKLSCIIVGLSMSVSFTAVGMGAIIGLSLPAGELTNFNRSALVTLANLNTAHDKGVACKIIEDHDKREWEIIRENNLASNSILWEQS